MTPMNWPVIVPELWLLVMACVVLLADLFSHDTERKLTFWLTQFSVAVFALLHLADYNAGTTAYGMNGRVVVDPMGGLLAVFAALAVMAGESGEVRQLLDFIDRSQRSLVR